MVRIDTRGSYQEGRSSREQLRCEVSKVCLAREHHSPQEHTLDVLKPPQLTRGGSGNMLIYMCTLLKKVDPKWSFWRLGDQDELFVSNKCTSRYAQLAPRSATARFGRSPNIFFQPSPCLLVWITYWMNTNSVGEDEAQTMVG